jgi:hypothetical protein
VGRQDVRQSQGRGRSASTRGRGGWAAGTWHDVTGHVRSITSQMRSLPEHLPFAPTRRTTRDRRRDVDAEWDAAAPPRRRSGPHDDHTTSDSREASAPDWPSRTYPGAKKAGTPSRWSGKRLSNGVLALLIVLGLILGTIGSDIMLRGLDLLAAGLDLSSQISTLESIAKGGGFTQPGELATMQSSLQSINNDLVRVQSDLPISLLESNHVTGGIVHMLDMARLLVNAGEYGVDAGQVLIPALKGMMTGLGTSAPASNRAPPVTIADLERVQYDVNVAARLLYQAMQERDLVSDRDLQSIGLGKAASILHKLDSIRPKLPQYLNDVNYAAAVLPTLLGMKGPAYSASYLLFDEDSDELRPSGGFLGNYAVLTFSQGKLTSGVHLQDIYTLDCPGLGYPYGCKPNQIPNQYSWLADDPMHFGVRDSNLDPDFTVSSSYIEQNYTRETGKSVGGVIAFTPAFIGRIVDLLGGISIPQYGVKVTSANLEDTIHYFHILYGYCEAHASDPLCAQKINGGGTQKSDKKAFDALLGSAVLHAVATAGGKLQGEVIRATLESVLTRDLQIYFNDPGVEHMLNLFHADNTIPAVNGDQLLLVDANTGATYASGDLQEQVSDNITLNADGSAYHDMTVTYTYPWVKHRYGSIYAAAVQAGLDPWQYTGVLQVMVPQTSSWVGRSNCSWPFYPPAEAGRQVWGCAPVYVNCNACDLDGTNNGAQPGATVIELRWLVAGAVTTSGNTHTYNLGLIHQAGSHSQVTVTISAPNGQSLSSASSANPPLHAANGGIQFTTHLFATDQSIAVKYTG